MRYKNYIVGTCGPLTISYYWNPYRHRWIIIGTLPTGETSDTLEEAENRRVAEQMAREHCSKLHTPATPEKAKA